jgi:tRNA pseudouridine38/39 synthase
MATKPLHPFIADLERNPSGSPSALYLLNYLLETKAVTEEAVRSAYAACWTTRNNGVEGVSGGGAGIEMKRGGTKVTKDDSNPKNLESASAKVRGMTSTATAMMTTTTNAPMIQLPVAVVRRRHIALRIYYDGGAYTGLAENVGMANDKSIERALFTALRQAHMVTSRDECGYSRCGRTDRGVSSAGQVVALHIKSAFAPEATLRDPREESLSTADKVEALANEDLPNNSHEKLRVWVPPKAKKHKKGKDAESGGTHQQWLQKELSEYAYDKILNNLLPPDIRVLGWTPVSVDFSARFSCTARTYRYFFVRRTMNLDRMLQGLQLMVGTHDFRNFCKMDVEKVSNFERKVHSAEIVTVDEDTCYLLIVGQAFLWHQIRCIAHVLFLIGRGLEEPSIVSELLDVGKHPGKPSYPLADERPLVLHDCQYSNLSFGYSVSNLWNIVCQHEMQWEDFVLAAARVRSCIASLQDAVVVTAELSDFCATKLKHREKKKKGKHLANNAVDFGSPVPFSSATVTWKEALAWLKAQGLTPEPDKSTEFVYTQLLERSKGTTYEEKVEALQNSTKRRQKYEDNVIKKRQTKEEDASFYAHMAKQGGSAQ